MTKTTLVIMAAGIGSRFGGGIKQLEAVGPSGEIIMDYSISDALDAGFDKILFIIRKDIEGDFRSIIGNHIERIADVSYAFQELDDLPDGFCKPDARTKPWGTGQAILACKDFITTPFAVINADDYYGKEAFVKLHDFLVHIPSAKTPLHFCMAGFILGNTLSENGGVTRGICQADEFGGLLEVSETSNIIKTETGAGILQANNEILPIDANSYVSMNMWGFTPAILPILEKGFVEFLSGIESGDLKKEYLLPHIVDHLIQTKSATVSVLETHDKWFGVTYKEDKETVVNSFAELIKQGIYPTQLFEV